jgi:hypothetical protein
MAFEQFSYLPSDPHLLFLRCHLVSPYEFPQPFDSLQPFLFAVLEIGSDILLQCVELVPKQFNLVFLAL